MDNKRSWIFNLMDGRADGLKKAQLGLQETGQSLVKIEENGMIDAIGRGDDIGLSYFIPKLAQWLAIDVLLAYKLVVGGVILLSIINLFYGFRKLFSSLFAQKIISIILILIGLFVLNRSDVHFAKLMVFSFLPLMIFYLWKEGQWNSKFLVFIAIVGVITGYANFIRSHTGTSFLVLFLPLIFFSTLDVRFKLLSVLTFLLTFNIAKFHFDYEIEHRNNWLVENKIFDSIDFESTHVFWHSIYIGMGYYPNQYVADYRDEVAAAKVKSIDPSVKYCSREYEEILKNEFFDLLKKDPFWFIRTFLIKGLQIILYLSVFFNVGFLLLRKINLPWKFWITFIIGLGFAIIPSLLVVPRLNYLLSGIILVGILNIFLIGKFIEENKITNTKMAWQLLF